MQMEKTQQIWKILERITDPEIPVLTIIDLGIVREVNKLPTGLEIVITPTYSGCPAMNVISTQIKFELMAEGFDRVTVREVLEPAWTTDWMSEAGKQKLKAYGIAPPQKGVIDKSALFAEAKSVQCPHCNSENTKMVSQFGSTPCKAMYKCLDCLEPFDYFKCH